jgi:hypothetical protein
LVALITAIGAGMLEYYLASWLHVNEVAVSLIIAATVGTIAWVWYRMEGKR